MDLRKRKISSDISSEPSSSSNVSKSVKTTISDESLSKDQIEKIVKYISEKRFVTKMTYLQLRKLEALSKNENNITILVCIFKHMNSLFKNSQISKHQTDSTYIRAKMLDIMRQIINELADEKKKMYIEEISNNMYLARFILEYFDLSENKITIQKIIFQFQTLIVTHVRESRNNPSNWEFHLLHYNYFVGNNIICLLLNSAKDDGVLMEGITMLEALSQNISITTDFLKHMFNLNNLAFTAIKCFWKYDATQQIQTDTFAQSLNWWKFTNKWQNLIININGRSLFLHACDDITNITYENLCILRIANYILHRNKDSLESLSKKTLAMSYPALYKCILLLQNIPLTVYTPQIDRCITTILQCHDSRLQKTIESINEKQSKTNDKNLQTLQDDISIMEQYFYNVNKMRQYLEEKREYWNQERIHKIKLEKANSNEIRYDVDSIDINVSQEAFERDRIKIY
ncbi:uncharacterized protein LOC109857405 [Pseudomyrmex gracilis]|uniref:uncharacterized protein LOC109857405 n=1 Tax=Pseudomyrmex gracilis TaxID=219809 RepID=UPI0009959A9C|nr:uncharacterized protein LOC109857405 [Pseudomyrmex gracilis]XP_020289269.1 uncharacterized protein LOC109857405 [Pseudomyrmex gracilis]